ncbi:MAG: ligase-associated DNA damage response endonuclease PdeM [Desulfobacterales bacterium]
MGDRRTPPSASPALTMGTALEQVCCGQRLLLLPERALFWQERKMLVVADPHFGKAQLFRERGVPVPRGTTADDLARLSRLMDVLRPRRLLFLGDLTHGPLEDTVAFHRQITPWRQRYRDIEFFLVSGNHDRHNGPPSVAFRFDRITTQMVEGPFVFNHQPQRSDARYSIAGHLHPAVVMTGRGALKATLPCFCFGPQGALLPAFGGFTGNHAIRPLPDDRVFVIADHAVLELPETA